MSSANRSHGYDHGLEVLLGNGEPHLLPARADVPFDCLLDVGNCLVSRLPLADAAEKTRAFGDPVAVLRRDTSPLVSSSRPVSAHPGLPVPENLTGTRAARGCPGTSERGGSTPRQHPGGANGPAPNPLRCAPAPAGVGRRPPSRLRAPRACSGSSRRVSPGSGLTSNRKVRRVLLPARCSRTSRSPFRTSAAMLRSAMFNFLHDPPPGGPFRWRQVVLHSLLAVHREKVDRGPRQRASSR